MKDSKRKVQKKDKKKTLKVRFSKDSKRTIPGKGLWMRISSVNQYGKQDKGNIQYRYTRKRIYGWNRERSRRKNNGSAQRRSTADGAAGI